MKEVTIFIKPYACNYSTLIEEEISLPMNWKIYDLQDFLLNKNQFHVKHFYLQARDQLILRLSLFHDFQYLIYLSNIVPTTVPAAEQLTLQKSNTSSSKFKSKSSRIEMVILVSD